MDFFQHQADARRSTRILIPLFGLAIALTIGLLYGAWEVWVWITSGFGRVAANLPSYEQETFHWVEWGALRNISFFVLTLVGAGSLYKTWTLRTGGPGIALDMGAEFVLGDEDEPAYRQLVNVVEEMAIASGVSTPSIFVLHATGINAFAAGWSLDDAAIVVTRGALQHLSRDELQAVVAHEFSHILHGDMRLNVVLMAVLHGLTLLSGSAWEAVQGDPDLRSGGAELGPGTQIYGALAGHPVGWVAAMVLFVAGSVGLLFGNLIKATVSRHREFLADASAVQFTRNPEALANALKKLKSSGGMGSVSARGVAAASHLFLDNPMKAVGFGWLSTHPPLEDRIRRLDPGWDGSVPRLQHRRWTPGTSLWSGAVTGLPQAAISAAGGVAGMAPAAPRSLGDRPDLQSAETWRTAAPVDGPKPGPTLSLHAANLCAGIGAVDPELLHDSAAMLRSLPPEVYDAAHVPLGAVGIVYALLLDTDPAVRGAQLKILQSRTHPEVLGEAWRLDPLVAALPPGWRLPLLDVCAPALRSLSAAQAREADATVAALAHADDRIDVFEFALHQVLRQQLAEVLDPGRRRTVQFHSMGGLIGEAAQVLSWISWAGAASPEEAAAAYAAATPRLKAARGRLPRLRLQEQCRLDWLENSLERLALASPLIRAQVVEGCAYAALADDTVQLAEAELLRAVAHVLAVPVPPLHLSP